MIVLYWNDAGRYSEIHILPHIINLVCAQLLTFGCLRNQLQLIRNAISKFHAWQDRYTVAATKGPQLRGECDCGV
jgi:hypothetical protein